MKYIPPCADANIQVDSVGDAYVIICSGAAPAARAQLLSAAFALRSVVARVSSDCSEALQDNVGKRSKTEVASSELRIRIGVAMGEAASGLTGSIAR
jgi:class 3 adenylate cyclase